jgi:dihydroxyacetone kinase
VDFPALRKKSSRHVRRRGTAGDFIIAKAVSGTEAECTAE